MSLRPRRSGLDAPVFGEAIGDILNTIDRARAANSAFIAANPADVDASLYEKAVESFKPWELTFTQSIEAAGAYGGTKVKHELKLSGGVYSRLRGMVNALTTAVEPVYTGDGWAVVQPGNVYKVCTKPDDSYGAWAFTKIISPGEDEGGWVIPGGLANPERALRAIFSVPMATASIQVVIDEVEYIIAEKYPEVLGQLATFKVERASYFRDKVSN